MTTRWIWNWDLAKGTVTIREDGGPSIVAPHSRPIETPKVVARRAKAKRTGQPRARSRATNCWLPRPPLANGMA